MELISLCENCAYKMADCKGNKDVEKVKCEYFKKPMVVNFKKMAEELSAAERQLADALEENGRLSHDNFELKKEIADWRAKAVQKWVDSRDDKSCSGCIHYDKEEWELPCVRCSRGNKDYWRGDNNG